MTNQQAVEEFMHSADEPVRETPGLPEIDQRNLRFRLIAEEFQELKDAGDNLEKIADAIGDLLYVVIGTAAAHGLDSQAIFDEIHRSNMTKFIDGYKRSDGKWCKGPSWTPPDLKRFIQQEPPQLGYGEMLKAARLKRESEENNP